MRHSGIRIVSIVAVGLYVPALRTGLAYALLFTAVHCAAADAARQGQEASSTHWSFYPPEKPMPPDIAMTGANTPIDSFIAAELKSHGFDPSPEASRETLLRRVSLDLTGLPPTVEELDSYLSDERADAYEHQVDRLLASPHFGEKWARWWLDLASYADSDGYLSDFLRPYAWRYRQWVIDSLNSNLPFDQFTIEQLAGDLLPNATESQRIATGFNRNTLSNREGGADLEEFRDRQVVQRTNNVGIVWLGLTMECAQCHNHKFDPISQEDYYRLYAFFNTADEVNIDAPIGDERERYLAARPAYEAKRAELLAPVAAELDALQAEWERRMLEAVGNTDVGDSSWLRAWEVLGLIWGQNYGEGQLEGTEIVRTPVDQRTAEQRERLQDYFLDRGAIVNEARWAELKIGELSGQLAELKKTLPTVTRAPTLKDSREFRVTHLHKRGDFRSPGSEVAPGPPAVLPTLNVERTANRLDLAQWLVRPDNPLTSRVVVNRVWQELFGRGLVSTPADFGTRGAKPSHPALLDWLAVEFVDNGWDMKGLIRSIVTSATYRQSSDARPEVAAIDPENALLARQSRVRLSAEIVRDNALAVSGLLNPEIGGPSVKPPQPASVTMEGFMNEWVPSEGDDQYRRGIYTFIQRTSPYGQFVTFDLPDVNRPCARRDRSNTPLQALDLLNEPVFVEAARALARRVESYALRSARERGTVSSQDCVQYAFRLCIARNPSAAEADRLQQYLDYQTKLFAREDGSALTLLADRTDGGDAVESASWVALCSVLLNLDEFITRE